MQPGNKKAAIAPQQPSPRHRLPPMQAAPMAAGPSRNTLRSQTASTTVAIAMQLQAIAQAI